ncbi:class I SAM-dependent methyltransferase [Anaerosporobacter sp.]
MIDTQESITAKLCSFARAYHSNFEKQKIFDDYLAYDLMGKEEYDKLGQLIQHQFHAEDYIPNIGFRGEVVYPLLNQYISPIPLSRIAYAERELKEFAKQNGECQYVICGAGMDTFSFRNDNPNIRIYELDHPDTQRYKLEKIRNLEWNIPENVHFVPIDFAKDDMKETLIAAGYSPLIPTFFTILGVTYYLTLPVFEQTIENISRLSGEGNITVFDYPDETTFSEESADRVKLLTKMTASLGEVMKQGYSFEDMESALKRHGFLVKGHLTPDDIQKNFFENRSDNQRAYENIHFITAIKG